jgi:hypothetical protein
LSEDRTGCDPKIMFRGPLPYKFEPGRQGDRGAAGQGRDCDHPYERRGRWRNQDRDALSPKVERSDLERHAGASAVKIRFA